MRMFFLQEDSSGVSRNFKDALFNIPAFFFFGSDAHLPFSERRHECGVMRKDGHVAVSTGNQKLLGFSLKQDFVDF